MAACLHDKRDVTDGTRLTNAYYCFKYHCGRLRRLKNSRIPFISAPIHPDRNRPQAHTGPPGGVQGRDRRGGDPRHSRGQNGECDSLQTHD